jgi:spermidine/putrescine transport system substrate-binding protein
MLDTTTALGNFSYIGYQPPQNSINPSQLVSDGYLPANLASCTVLPEYFDVGFRLLEMSPSVTALWQQQWQKFKAGG